MSSSQPPAQPPTLVAQRLSPIPGSRGYRNLQLQIVKETLAAVSEPTRGRKDSYPNMKEVIDTWSRAITFGESQMAQLGPRVDPALLRTTLQLQFKRSLVYWRMFRFMDLPPEIISNIFHLVVWSASHPLEGVRQRLRLTWVCGVWRRLMIEDPMIWNAIWFHDAPPYERSWEWFKRAGSARLDIRLNEVDPQHTSIRDPPKFTAQQMSDILDRLFTKLSQIRMLVVIVELWPPALTVLQKLQTAGNAGVPINIERLEVHRCGMPYLWIGPGFDTQGHRDPAVLFGGKTHSLRYLCLSGIHIDFDDTPLSNLTTLDLRHIAMESSLTLRRFREILQNCPNLDKLTLDGCGPQPEPRWFDHAPVELPNLKIFTIGSFSLSFACFIVAQVHAPRVRDLTLMTLTGGDYIPLIGMLTRKFTQVRILTLYNVHLELSGVGKRAFVRWLDTMPEIGYTRLARMKPEILYLFAEDPMHYRKPSEKPGSETALPIRHVLCQKLQYMEVQALPPATIAEFCRLRRSRGTPIKKTYLNTPWADGLTPDDIKLLQHETTLYIAPVGSNTAEENMLLSEGWDR